MTALIDSLMRKGWRAVQPNSPLQYTSGNCRYATFMKDGVRMAFDWGRTLRTEYGLSAMIYNTHDEKDIILCFLAVDADQRGQGKARAALETLIKIADRQKLTLYLEPVPLLDKPVKAGKLADFYASFGFVGHTPRNVTMVRQPAPAKRRPAAKPAAKAPTAKVKAKAARPTAPQ